MTGPAPGRLRAELEHFFGAVRFFTRWPVPAWVGHSAEGLNQSARYFSLVGALVGAWGALVFGLADAVLPQPVAALLCVTATILATGAFHEDGLADMVDGFGGGWTRGRILEIMKDSRVGSFGAIAVCLALLARVTALAELPAAVVPGALVAGHSLSRALSTTLLSALDYAREDLDSKAKPLATRLSGPGLLQSLGVAAACLGLIPMGISLFVAVLMAAGATAWIGRQARRWLGGYTGDCLGAAQQLSEIAFLVGLLVELG